VLYSTLASAELATWRALEAYGCDADAMFVKAGLDPHKLHEPGSRYAARASARLWELFRDETQDPGLGLKVATFWHPASIHALGFAWLASSSLQEALERIVRYYRVVTDIERVTLEHLPHVTKLYLHIPSTDIAGPDEIYDAFFASLILMCRHSYGDHFAPRRLSLARPAPVDTDAFKAFFRCPVEFGAPAHAISLDSTQLREILPTGNAELAHASDRIVTRYLAQLDRRYLSMQVKALLIDRLSSGNVSQESVAEELHVSLRTLQRRLEDEETTYKEILDETRQELAAQYVRQSHLAINEIGFLLGFSEPANFSRAFRRWNGVSPSIARAAG